MSFVLDCSMTMAWVFLDEATPHTQAIQEKLLEQDAIVPSLWAIEVANILLTATKKKRIKAQQWPTIIEQLNALPIFEDSQTFEQATSESLPLAYQNGISVYDATYLELAKRRKLPLATLDKKLKQIAHQMKVTTL